MTTAKTPTPHRIYNEADFPHRKTSFDAARLHGEFTEALFEEIQSAEERSRPSAWESTARHKDMDAFVALECAGEIVGTLAGWAIDHTVGLALNGLQWVPRPPPVVQSLPEYLASCAAVDDHVHEKAGGAQKSFKDLDPAICRKIFLGLLRANPGGFPNEIQEMMVEALEALEFGETLAIVQAVAGDRKRKFRELRLQLFAIELIEYRKAKGIDKSITEKQVGAAYGVSGTTVRLWKGPLCVEPGQLEVARRIDFAKCTAASEKRKGPQVKLHLSKRYGNEALEQAGAKFKEILKGS